MPSAQEPTEVFDYIVVGAGSSGSAVAARLSANGEASVLLLEAGLRDRKPAVHIPAAFSQLFRSDRDWNYDTIPQPELGDRRIYWPRGKMLGGSSSLNAMMWVRGFAADYDKWGGSSQAHLVLELPASLFSAGRARGRHSPIGRGLQWSDQHLGPASAPFPHGRIPRSRYAAGNVGGTGQLSGAGRVCPDDGEPASRSQIQRG